VSGSERKPDRAQPSSNVGWREAPGWFPSQYLQGCGIGTTPRGMRFAIPLPS